MKICMRCLVLGLVSVPIIMAHVVYKKWKSDDKFMATLDELSKRFAEVDKLRVELERKDRGKEQDLRYY